MTAELAAEPLSTASGGISLYDSNQPDFSSDNLPSLPLPPGSQETDSNLSQLPAAPQPAPAQRGDCYANPVGSLQAFTAAACEAAATPTGTNFTPLGCFSDERDNKVYEVRKFADGKCWLVDNLMYGGASAQGGSDACKKVTHNMWTNATPTDRFGEGTYIWPWMRMVCRSELLLQKVPELIARKRAH